jgi:hypothetical protein
MPTQVKSRSRHSLSSSQSSRPVQPASPANLHSPAAHLRPMGARRMWSGMANASTRGTATPRSSLHSAAISRWMALACRDKREARQGEALHQSVAEPAGGSVIRWQPPHQRPRLHTLPAAQPPLSRNPSQHNKRTGSTHPPTHPPSPGRCSHHCGKGCRRGCAPGQTGPPSPSGCRWKKTEKGSGVVG